MESLGATNGEVEHLGFPDFVYTVDYEAPAGKYWIESGAHNTWIRERTLTDCWKALIETARAGLADCDATCAECADANAVEPELTPERIARLAEFKAEREAMEARQDDAIAQMRKWKAQAKPMTRKQLKETQARLQAEVRAMRTKPNTMKAGK